jgi:hypothetical protein
MKFYCCDAGSDAEESYRKHLKGSSPSRGHTSAQELVLAKPVMQSKKFILQSSRLSVTEKSSSTTIKISGEGGGDILGLRRWGCHYPCSDAHLGFV